MALALPALNGVTEAEFVAALGAVFEHAPWVAAMAAAGRPYATLADLHAALRAAVEAAPDSRRLALLTGHPELAGRAARAGTIAAASLSASDSRRATMRSTMASTSSPSSCSTSHNSAARSPALSPSPLIARSIRAG